MAYYARPNEDGSCYQPLAEHILQTAQLARSSAESIGLGMLLFVCGLLHDLGKYLDEYQRYIREVGAALAKGIIPPPARVDHGVYGALYIYIFCEKLLESSEASTCTINGKEISKTVIKRARDLITMCICYHHGSLQDFIPVGRNEEPVLLKRLRKLESTLADENKSNWEQVQSRFFNEVCSEDRLQSYLFQAIFELDTLNSHINEQAFVCHHPENAEDNSNVYLKSLQNYAWQMLVRYTYSALIDADRWDAYIYQTNSDEDYNHSIEQHLESYLHGLYHKLEEFNAKKPTSPSEAKVQQVRAEISEICSKAASRHTGLYDLTVPTGGGKTFASLRFALEHAKFLQGTAEAKERIIYVLPYTSIIEQNAHDVRDALKSSNDEVLEVHSQVTFQEDGSRAKPDEADKNTLVDETRYKLLAERYNSPIIFMTQVSFLETLVKAHGQYARRFNHLANSIIILDEAQTLPLHSTYISNAAINCLVSCFNSTVLMCTATQPPLDQAIIPLLFSENKHIIPESNLEINQELKRVEILDVRKDAGYSLEKGAEWLTNNFLSSQSVLIVLNTKKGVKQLAELLKDQQKEFEIIYLTTYLCAAHRKEKIAEIKRKLANGDRLMVVSTTLIECGVNLSFEVVVRNLAGLPSIVQSCGRGNRNAEKELGYGYIVSWNENIKNLANLSAQQTSTKSVIRSLRKVTDTRNADLLSPFAMQEYYRKYFIGSIKKKMAYPINNGNAYLYEYLDSRQIDLLEFAERWPFDLKIAFRFVSERYEVIGNGGSTLIVPYKEGKSLQVELLNAQNLPLSDRYRLLRKIQPYTVNMYINKTPSMNDDSFYTRLCREGLYIVPGFNNLYIVKDGFYNEEFGVSATGMFDDVCIFE
ncbi:MAG: CRISPR-associated helicase Cas3' [Eubacteriales bacterium]|nr:CRISPR-associated helicase Cas3' [Eubacteriales bacterium]